MASHTVGTRSPISKKQVVPDLRPAHYRLGQVAAKTLRAVHRRNFQYCQGRLDEVRCGNIAGCFNNTVCTIWFLLRQIHTRRSDTNLFGTFADTREVQATETIRCRDGPPVAPEEEYEEAMREDWESRAGIDAKSELPFSRTAGRSENWSFVPGR